MNIDAEESPTVRGPSKAVKPPPPSSPPRTPAGKDLDASQKLPDHALHCEPCLIKRKKIALSIWDHVSVELDSYKNSLYAPTMQQSAESILYADKPLEADFKPVVTNLTGISSQSMHNGRANFGEVLSGSARWSGPLGAQDLCAYPPLQPRFDQKKEGFIEPLEPAMSAHSETEVCPAVASAEKDSMFTPPTHKTHGTPT